MRRCLPVLLLALSVSVAAAQGGVVPRDGTWEGTDSSGRQFAFEVRNGGTRIEITGFSAIYKCKKANTGLSIHGFQDRSMRPEEEALDSPVRERAAIGADSAIRPSRGG